MRWLVNFFPVIFEGRMEKMPNGQKIFEEHICAPFVVLWLPSFI